MQFNKKPLIKLWSLTLVVGTIAALIFWRWLLVDACSLLPIGTIGITCPWPYLSEGLLYHIVLWSNKHIVWFLVSGLFFFFSIFSGTIVYTVGYISGNTIPKHVFFVRAFYVSVVLVLLALAAWILYATAY